MDTDMNQYLIFRYVSTVVRKMTAYRLCCAGLARSPFVLTEHISSYSCTRHILLDTFYSYRTARTCSEPRSVERRLSFSVEVTTASGNWKHPLPLKIIFSGRFQWLLCFKNG